MVVGEAEDRRERKYSNGEINHELTTLKRMLNLARQNGKLMHVPYVPMLKERNVRTGFFHELESRGSSLQPARVRHFTCVGVCSDRRALSRSFRLSAAQA